MIWGCVYKLEFVRKVYYFSNYSFHLYPYIY